jgi:hypothetical protein
MKMACRSSLGSETSFYNICLPLGVNKHITKNQGWTEASFYNMSSSLGKSLVPRGETMTPEWSPIQSPLGETLHYLEKRGTNSGSSPLGAKCSLVGAKFTPNCDVHLYIYTYLFKSSTDYFLQHRARKATQDFAIRVVLVQPPLRLQDGHGQAHASGTPASGT